MPFTLNTTNKFSFTPQKIDYGNIANQVQATMDSVNQTMQNWKNYRQSLGVKTKEEEEAERLQQLERDKKAAVEKSSAIWSELGNSEDVYDWYNAHEPDPQKQAEFAQKGAQTAGYLSTIPLTVLSAGTMGWVPAITSTATGFGGAYLGQKAGEYIDSKTGWNTTPWLTFGGGLLGGWGGYKGLVKAGSAGWLRGSGQMYGKQFIGDVAADAFNKGIKQGNPYLSTYLWKDFLTQEMTDPDRAIHVSPNPIAEKPITTKAAHSSGTKWVPGSAERSLVGDDNMVWLWEGKPYRNQWNDQTFISIPKSNNIVQTRQARAVGVPEIDLTNPSTKIITRNPITDGFERQIVVSGPEPITPVKTSYRFFERPTTAFKVADDLVEVNGKMIPRWQLPKGSRNFKPKVKTFEERQINNFENSSYTQLGIAPPIDEAYLENSMRSRAQFQKEMGNKFEDLLFGGNPEFTKNFQTYINSLPETEINPLFATTISEGLEQPSHAVRSFRNYLLHADAASPEISDADLAKFLTHYHKQLSGEATGKLKDKILWHGSPRWFDAFDFKGHVGANTGNSGVIGPGNYFSNNAARYGATRSHIDYSIILNNQQPYVITGIQSTPDGKTMIQKGIIPNGFSKLELSNVKTQDILQQQLDNIPVIDNRAYLDFTEPVPGMWIPSNGNTAVMLRRNTGIKSLYPHPSRFVRNADGTVTLIPTDWNDSRVNFKEGGKINPQ